MPARSKRPLFTAAQAAILARSPHLLPLRRLAPAAWLCLDLGWPDSGHAGLAELGPYILDARGAVVDVGSWLRALPEAASAVRTYRFLLALETVNLLAVPARA